MTAVYVRRLFDQHAPDFDRALLERLDYRGPELLLDGGAAVGGQPMRLGSVLDLGCGTGLAGAAFRPFCDWLVGVDISPGMIEQARAKGLYDRLVVADLLEFLAGEAGAQYHLVLAADVFVYCSDLAPIAAAVAGVLAPGGLFAFTVETHDGSGRAAAGDAALRPWRGHVRAAIAAAGLQLVAARRSLDPHREGRAGAGAAGGGRDAASTAPPSAARHVKRRDRARTPPTTAPLLPETFARWFAQRGWTPRAHQLELLARARDGRSVLLIAPTGGGKTLAGFLPTLVELSEAAAAQAADAEWFRPASDLRPPRAACTRSTSRR